MAVDATGALGVIIPSGGRPQIWDLMTGKLKADLKGIGAEVLSLDFLPKTDTFLTTAPDGTAIIWDTRSGKLLRKFSILGSRSSAARDVKIDPSGTRLLVMLRNEFAHIVDLSDPKITYSVGPHGASTAVFTSDGKLAALAAANKVTVVDVATGRQVHDFSIENVKVGGLAFSPDNSTLAVGTEGGQIRIFGLKTFQTQKNATTAEVRDCRSRVWVPYRLLGTDIPNVSHNHEVSSPQELSLVRERLKQAVPLFKENDGFRNASEEGTFKAITTDLDQRIAVTGELGRHKNSGFTYLEDILIWDLETLTLRGRLKSVYTGGNYVLSSDGKALLTFDTEDSVKIWSMATLQKTHTLSDHAGSVAGACFSRDGTKVATIDANSANLWDAATGQKLQSWPTDFEPLYMDFSEDGSSLVVSDDPGDTAARPRIFAIAGSTQQLVQEAKKSVARCLAPTERKRLSLSAEPPEWCIKMGKAPYNAEIWRAWLRDREIGKQVSLPIVE